jgi:DNA-binding MarR family transcriptional regulator
MTKKKTPKMTQEELTKYEAQILGDLFVSGPSKARDVLGRTEIPREWIKSIAKRFMNDGLLEFADHFNRTVGLTQKGRKRFAQHVLETIQEYDRKEEIEASGTVEKHG